MTLVAGAEFPVSASAALEAIFRKGTAPMALQRIAHYRERENGHWFEALLRPSQLGFNASPLQTVQSAAATGCERALDRIVVLTALRILASDPAIGLLSINLSPGTCTDYLLPEFVADAMAVRRIKPERLCVEFPETAQLNCPEVIQAMFRWRGLGVQVAVDDMGTGLCCLRPIVSGAVDIIKIDAAILNDIVSTQSSQMAYRMAGVSRTLLDLGMRVVFEGVENKNYFPWLDKLPHTGWQGFANELPEPWRDVEINSRLPDPGRGGEQRMLA